MKQSSFGLELSLGKSKMNGIKTNRKPATTVKATYCINNPSAPTSQGWGFLGVSIPLQINTKPINIMNIQQAYIQHKNSCLLNQEKPMDKVDFYSLASSMISWANQQSIAADPKGVANVVHSSALRLAKS